MKATHISLLAVAAFTSSIAAAQTKPAARTTLVKTTTKTTTTQKTTPATKTTTAPRPAARPASATRTTVTAKPAIAKPTSQTTATTPAAPLPAAPAEATDSKVVLPGGAVSFAKGTVVANLGVGIGHGYGYGFGYGGALKATPALSLSVEKGIVDGIGPGVISVGGLIGYKGYNYDWSAAGDTYEASWKNFIVTVRGAYHYNFTTNPKLDTYAGISLGARIENYSNNYNDTDLGGSYGGTYLTSGIFLGGRYFFTDNIGAFAELGYDMSYLKLGLSAKF
ncbi:hypothetical protein [Hymenobacter sediminicola]|uniref:Outer membrane beta-barrel protein n=1 Tax=Hymenobacter sediminicola TaxID=2761579 RepID=A0A7G7W633_9BACT|nr:hypothetical protein [Hymenobacter sediminicola]QNH61826.1 hypothetical protein H4317_17005 [Hymenobacter sediminicola]